ncbi:MAG: hypothetical protein NUV80_07115, partial [Candidatus Berkelbacteria bacterium]|nr:hypothetical protein [Candidatus Berkelbacteria bacterium]
AGQPIHQRFVRSGLLILGAAPLNLQRLQQIRTELSRACDSIISNGTDYIFILSEAKGEDTNRYSGGEHIFINHKAIIDQEPTFEHSLERAFSSYVH